MADHHTLASFGSKSHLAASSVRVLSPSATFAQVPQAALTPFPCLLPFHASRFVVDIHTLAFSSMYFAQPFSLAKVMMVSNHAPTVCVWCHGSGLKPIIWGIRLLVSETPRSRISFEALPPNHLLAPLFASMITSASVLMPTPFFDTVNQICSHLRSLTDIARKSSSILWLSFELLCLVSPLFFSYQRPGFVKGLRPFHQFHFFLSGLGGCGRLESHGSLELLLSPVCVLILRPAFPTRISSTCHSFTELPSDSVSRQIVSSKAICVPSLLPEP